MAPEVFAGGTVSPRSDVFSLAATLWTLLTGKPPVYADPTQAARAVVPGVSTELEQTLTRRASRCIPERRVASVAAFATRARRAARRERRASRSRISVERPDVAAQPDRGDRARPRRASSRPPRLDRAGRPHHGRARLPGGLGRRRAARSSACGCLRARASPARSSQRGEGQAVPDCRNDPRFAAQIAAGTGYVPYTMLVVPLKRGGEHDRRAVDPRSPRRRAVRRRGRRRARPCSPSSR